MENNVAKVNAELSRIDHLREEINKVIYSKFNTFCPNRDVTINAGILSQINERLFDLKRCYERLPVPFPIREE